MNWTSERWAALAYGVAALAAGSIWYVLLGVATPPNVSMGGMLREMLFEGSHRVFSWWLAILPALCILLAAAYLTPLARRKRAAVGLLMFGVALAVAAWSTMVVPVAFLATIAPLLIIASGRLGTAGETRTPKCPRCGGAITRRQIALATFPHWLSCQSCKTPLIGDNFVKRVTTVLGLFLAFWFLAVLFAIYSIGMEMGGPVVIFGSMLYLALWAISVFLTSRRGSYVEREPTSGRWWALDVWQWLRRHRHNVVTFVGCTLLFLAFFVASLWLVENFGDLEWVRTAHSPYIYAAFGFGIYFLLLGHPWTRVILVAAVPLCVRVIVTLLGHVPAGDLTTAFVYGGYDSVVFAIGAAIASVLAWLLSRKQASPAA